MTEHTDHQPDAAWWNPRSLLSPAGAAVAAFAIAFISLDGQNLLVTGIQSLFGQAFFNTSHAPNAYYVAWGLAALVPLALVLLLALVTLSAVRTGWESHLARAAVLVAAVAAGGALLTALGGLVHGGF